MGALSELLDLQGDWPLLGAGDRTSELGAFGHADQRRLGLRAQSSAWALLSRGTCSIYAVAVELSPTGVVLEFVGRRFRLVFRPHLRFRLDLFVPQASSHIRGVVRSVRPIGDRQAFEFVDIDSADRLTLAEYLDRLMSDPTGSAPNTSIHRRRHP